MENPIIIKDNISNICQRQYNQQSQFSQDLMQTDQYLNNLWDQMQKENNLARQNLENQLYQLQNNQLSENSYISPTKGFQSPQSHNILKIQNQQNNKLQQSQQSQQYVNEQVKNEQQTKCTNNQQNKNENQTVNKEEQTYVKQQNVSNQKQFKLFREGTMISEVIALQLAQQTEDKINFGCVVPGQILEQGLIVKNISDVQIAIKINIACLNKEFDDHDEYIYSIRKTSGYDYNEKTVVLIPPKKYMQFKIALKVPDTVEKKILFGEIQISVQGLQQQQIKSSIQAQIDLPNLSCPKQLFDIKENINIIKLAIKKGKKIETKIPFKNNYEKSLNFELSWLDDDSQECPYDIATNQNPIFMSANNSYILNLTLKPNINFNDCCSEKCEIRKVLLLKIKNSTVIFSFPILIELF